MRAAALTFLILILASPALSIDPQCLAFDDPTIDPNTTWAAGVDLTTPGVVSVGMCSPIFTGGATVLRYDAPTYAANVGACVVEIDGRQYRHATTSPGQFLQVFVGTEIWDPDQQRTALAWCELPDGTPSVAVATGPVAVPVPEPPSAPLHSAP